VKQPLKLSQVLTIKDGEIKPLFDPRTAVEQLGQDNYARYVKQCRSAGIEPMSYQKIIEILGTKF
jgi:hypothetical protein